MKDKCAWCGANIPKTLEYYSRYGNCCVPCNIRFDRCMGGVKDKFERKVRDYTDKEKDKMLFDRIKYVKSLKGA